jgi:hypothetical protein
LKSRLLRVGVSYRSRDHNIVVKLFTLNATLFYLVIKIGVSSFYVQPLEGSSGLNYKHVTTVNDHN